MYNHLQDDNNQYALELRQRMRMGTGVNQLIRAENAPTHHMDSLERFKKDYASYQREKRERDLAKKQMDIEKKRLEYLQRQNLRWEKAQQQFTRRKSRDINKGLSQMLGQKKTHNTNGVAYNPINLSYDANEEGQRLRRQDEDRDIRRYVRARNMDDRGNSKYDLISGRSRAGIQQVVPPQLNERYSDKLNQHYQNLKIRAPSENLFSQPRNSYHL